MNWITRRLFGRLPVGWLQLRHHRMRLAAAVAGVAFANMLVFVQLGILSAMNDVVRTSYSPFRADIVISPSNANTLTDGATLARRVVYQAIAQPGVAAAAPLYVGQVAWERPNVPATSLIVYALPPESKRFAGAAIAEQLDAVSAPMRAILDALSRDVDPAWAARASPDTPLEFEVDGKAIAAIGSYSMGAGFGWDGSLVVSDLTFMRLIRQRSMGTPSHVLVDLESGMEVAPALAQLRAMSGQTVVFQTALSVVCLASGFEQTDLAAVEVRFRTLNEGEIERYLRAEQPYDCAGSAKSEGLGIALLEAIHSDDPTALVGLPLIRTARMLRAAGCVLP